MKNNVAEATLFYYGTDDFKENYATSLFRSFHENKSEIVDKILELFTSNNYETQRDLSNWKEIDRKQAVNIHSLISDNFERFTDDFKSYYVGDTSLESVSFGEQCEQLTGIYNPKTEKEYSLKSMQKQFDKAGFYVNEGYAYMDLSSHGLHIDLLKGKELIDQFLAS